VVETTIDISRKAARLASRGRTAGGSAPIAEAAADDAAREEERHSVA
jgi:hypothetical protein